MKLRGYLIIGLIAVLIIVAIAAAAPPQVARQPKLRTCTVEPTLGIQYVTITNLNTGKSITKTLPDLPYSFNFTEGDALRFNATLQAGFAWNAWELNQHPWFADDNPLTIKPASDLCVTPRCIYRGE